MRNRFKNTLYTIEDLKYLNGRWQYVRCEDGTLFSGPYRTKIKPEDLPQWYVYGRYYKRFGYMSTNGITDLLYIPNRFSNHYLKDDCLLISYGGKIREAEIPEGGITSERYEGWDERVWGGEIVSILKGARIHSDYDIEPFIQKLKWKKEWLQKEYPDEFGPDRWNIDVDRMFSDNE